MERNAEFLAEYIKEKTGIQVGITAGAITPGEKTKGTVTFEALGIEKSVDVIVTAPAVKGEHTLTVEVLDAYSWSSEWNDDEGVYYEITATTAGTYTIYLPPHLGIVATSKWDKGGLPDFDPTGKIYDVDKNKFKIKLAEGETYRFYIMGAAVGTYTIGYDAP